MLVFGDWMNVGSTRGMVVSLMAACAAALALAAPEARAQALCENPTEGCGRLVQPHCLQSMGAGVLRAEGVGAEASGGCDAQMEAYRQCLSQVATECEPAERAAALDLSKLPSIQPFQVVSCSSPVARQMMCQGAETLLSAMVTSGDETDMKVFATMAGGVFALRGGAARRVADLSGKINAFAQFMQNVAVPLPEAPETLGLCLTFRPQGGATEWGVAQAVRLAPQTPAEVAKMTGQQLYMAAPASPQVVFETADGGCDAQLAALARENGL